MTTTAILASVAASASPKVSASASAGATAATAAPAGQPVLADPFLSACLDRVHDLDSLAWLMILAGLLLAAAAGGAAIYNLVKPAPAAAQGDDGENGPAALTSISSAVAEAISKLLETLGKLPVWFALFIGGMALYWLASDLSDGQCGHKPAPVALESQDSNSAKGGGNGPEETSAESPAPGSTEASAPPG